MPRATDHHENLPATALAAAVDACVCGSIFGLSLSTGDEALLLRCP